ncbi:hypothetical protein [Haladaptatus sp. YSMS36]|uniref:hypothetical protein n=1 Tax=Haladaptatus sp. YSMS36 TaxID=3033384 RepID=UPI0023E7D56A|nr:hypothetical protein [Haladaptatus sp. YSMS36]
MRDSSGRQFVDSRGGADEELVEELLQSLGNKAHRLRHLYDILQGDTKAPVWYYENTTSFDNARRWASNVVSSHPDEAVRFMNRADAEFTRYNLKRNAVVDFLARKDISRHVSQELEPSWSELLLLTYHTLYDEETRETPRYDLLQANARLFKYRSNHAYRYRRLDLDDLKGRVDAFVRAYNGKNSRPLSINCYPLDDGDEVVLDFYQESARVAHPVFDIRVDDDGADPLQPRIRYDSMYSIKTLSANIRKGADEYEVAYSKSPDNWEVFLRGFFEDVFDVTDPLRDEQRKRTESVEGVLDSAFEALSNEDASDEDVIEAINEPIERLSDEATESDAVEELDVETDELASIYESIEVVGITVRGVEEALTDTFQVCSTVPLRDWMDKNVTAEDSLKRVVADADPEAIGFILRGDLRGEDETPEEFILQDGVWKTSPGGISDDATEVLNVLFQPHDE